MYRQSTYLSLLVVLGFVSSARADEVLGAGAGSPSAPMSKQEDPFADYPGAEGPLVGAKKRKPKGAVFAGPAAVFGVMTWSPAIGFNAGGNLRLHDLFSLDLDIRAAWLPTDLEDLPIRSMTVDALLAGCLRFHVVFGCAVGYLGIVRTWTKEGSYFLPSTFNVLSPGAGGRIGVEVPIAGAFGIRVAADLVKLTDTMEIRFPSGASITQPSLMVGTNLNAVWGF